MCIKLIHAEVIVGNPESQNTPTAHYPLTVDLWTTLETLTAELHQRFHHGDYCQQLVVTLRWLEGY